jgi:hypothetical protein
MAAERAFFAYSKAWWAEFKASGGPALRRRLRAGPRELHSMSRPGCGAQDV